MSDDIIVCSLFLFDYFLVLRFFFVFIFGAEKQTISWLIIDFFLGRQKDLFCVLPATCHMPHATWKMTSWKDFVVCGREEEDGGQKIGLKLPQKRREKRQKKWEEKSVWEDELRKNDVIGGPAVWIRIWIWIWKQKQKKKSRKAKNVKRKIHMANGYISKELYSI